MEEFSNFCKFSNAFGNYFNKLKTRTLDLTMPAQIKTGIVKSSCFPKTDDRSPCSKRV
jgi:hypothetical protein